MDFIYSCSNKYMKPPDKRWRGLFLFCAGLTIAATFIMEWLADDFWLNDKKFSIIGLELFYSKKEVINVLTQIKEPAAIALNYQLIFDFVFMAGVYPCIASLCMMARERVTNNLVQTSLFALAMLQPVAWAFDIIENSYLLGWLSKPEIGDEFSIYHNIVAMKWVIALLGFVLSAPILLLNVRTKKRTLKI
jgi:hypothetical protein